MEQTEYTVTVLTASEGYRLTEADDSIADTERTIAQKVYLGVNDKAENWKEITVEEAETILAAAKAAAIAAAEEAVAESTSEEEVSSEEEVNNE